MKTVVIEIERVQFAEAIVEVPDDWTDRDLLKKDLKNTYGLVRTGAALGRACRYHSRVRGSKR